MAENIVFGSGVIAHHPEELFIFLGYVLVALLY